VERRGFLKALASAVAFVGVAAEVDLDKLIWTPKKRQFFIPEHPKIQGPDFAKIAREYRKYDNQWLVDAVAKDLNLPRHLVPRYTITVGVGDIKTPAGTFFLDDDWKVVGGRVVEEDGRIRPAVQGDIDVDISRQWAGLGGRWEGKTRDLVYARDKDGRIYGSHPPQLIAKSEYDVALDEAIATINKKGRG
jgi:hypothetical protein